MKYTKQKAFTLVELIVVVTILAILATIWFVSYSSYLTWVRDTNRIAQMTSLSDWLNLHSTRNDLSIPEDNIEVSVNGNLIAYQWYAGANILETINFEKGWVDPKDNTYFSYYLTSDRKYFQLMWFLEEWLDSTTNVNELKLLPQMRGIEGELSLISKTHAVNYQDRIPTVTGKKLWILTDGENAPVQEEGVNIDIDTSSTAADVYIARFTSTDILEWTLSELSSLNPKASCKRIRETSTARKDWVYKISPNGTEFEVYCDMTTDWGGWTQILNYLHADGTTPALTVLTDKFPLQSSKRLWTDEWWTVYWWHTSPVFLSNFQFNEVMFYCESSGHDRIIHFKTSHPNVLDYFKTWTWNMSWWNVQSLEYTKNLELYNNATIPLNMASEEWFINRGINLLTDFPIFWNSNISWNPRAHWGILWSGSRFECDDVAIWWINNTHHKVFFR
jgi:prepilin-type N-terminal cleavage/methylation domain-containing protein